MPNLRLTRRAVDDIPYTEGGQILYRDTLLRGFGLRVGVTTKVFFAEGQVNRRTRRVSIGRADVFAPEVARKKALRLLGDMADGIDRSVKRRAERSEQIAVALAFDRFFEGRRNLKPKTVATYRRTGEVLLKDWRKKPLKEITRQMVLNKHREITDKYGEVTANAAMRHFRSVYNFNAATFDDFPTNPVKILGQTRSWNKESRRQTIVTSTELPAWWKAVMCTGVQARDFLLLALFTGMRSNEIRKLRWENIDLKAKRLHVPSTKNGDPLDLPLSGFLTLLLKERRERCVKSQWVFPGTGNGGHIVSTRKFTKRVAKASGVNFTLHDLRRTYITIAESLDVPYYALKRLLNHRTSVDVTGGYIIIDPERLREPVEKIAERILALKDDD